MQPVRFDFPVITNSDYTEELSFQVSDGYFDLSGHSFALQIRAAPNASSVLSTLSTVNDKTQQGLFIIEPAYGALQVRFLWETVRALFLAVYPGYREGDAVSLYYDLLTTIPGGDREVWLFGYLNVRKGITNG